MVARLYHPPAPFSAPTTGDINQRLAEVANAINAKASATVPTAFKFLGLIDSTGQTWKVTIDTAGVLHTEVVPRP
jgi:hypothetical protein